MSKRRQLEVLGLAGVLLLMSLSPAAGQEASPCDTGNGTLIREWEAEGVPGTKGKLARSTMECLDDGRIRHVVEISKDEGHTWRLLFESTYAPTTAAGRVAPAPVQSTAPSPSAGESVREPSAAAPAEKTAESVEGTAQHQAARQTNVEGSEVQALSRELVREEIPEEEAPELVMASPMVLELFPGEVDDYPEGTAWSTDETAGFICGQVVLNKVTVGRKVKGGKTNLIVGVLMFTPKRSRNVDLLVEAMLDDEVVASELLEKVRLGLSIPAHGKKGLLVNALLELPGDGFERLFADGAVRKLRLTLTVPSG